MSNILALLFSARNSRAASWQGFPVVWSKMSHTGTFESSRSITLEAPLNLTQSHILVEFGYWYESNWYQTLSGMYDLSFFTNTILKHHQMSRSSSLGFTSWGSSAPEIRSAANSAPVVNAMLRSLAAVEIEVPPSSRVSIPRTRLVAWNCAMFVFHSILATVTLILGNTDLMVPLFATRLDFRFSEAPSGDVSSGVAPWEIVPVYEKSGLLPFTWLVAAFFILSAVFHLLNATVLRSVYLSWLEQCYTPTRWAEYTLSAPLMIVLISYTLGVRNREVLLANFALVMITMPFGYWVEVVARPKNENEWNDTLRYRLYPWLLGHIPQVAAWFIIISTFYGGQDMTDRAPWFVHLILWVEFVLFFSFGAASVVSQWHAPKFFYRGEITFQVLSLVSKGILGILLLTNVLMLSRFDDLYD